MTSQESFTGEANKNFLTLDRTDPRFHPHLVGTFSKTEVAIPVQSLNVDSEHERVTFQIIQSHQISRPSILKLLWQLVRPEWLLFVLAPALAVLNFCTLNQPSTHDHFYFALASVLFLHLSVLLYNDFSDYVQGADRLRPFGGRDFLKKGYLKAFQVRFAAMAFLALGILIGIVVIVGRPQTLLPIAGGAAFGIFGYSARRIGFKYLGLSELAVFFCYGPLLAMGFAQSLSNPMSAEVLLIGLAFGHLSVIALELRQLENVMHDSLARVRTFAVRLGFDRARKFIMVQFFLQLIFATVVVLRIFPKPISAIGLLIYSNILFWFFVRILKAKSPLSSGLDGLHKKITLLHVLLALIFGIA